MTINVSKLVDPSKHQLTDIVAILNQAKQQIKVRFSEQIRDCPVKVSFGYSAVLARLNSDKHVDVESMVKQDIEFVEDYYIRQCKNYDLIDLPSIGPHNEAEILQVLDGNKHFGLSVGQLRSVFVARKGDAISRGLIGIRYGLDCRQVKEIFDAISKNEAQ